MNHHRIFDVGVPTINYDLRVESINHVYCGSVVGGDDDGNGALT